MIILGIDPSLNATGYGLIKVDGSRLIYVASGTIKHKKEDELPKKLLNISNIIKDAILEYKPVRSGIEETFVNTNFKTSLKLGMVRGVVMVCLADAGIPIFEISPNLAKKSITGYGKAEKMQVAYMVSRLLSGIPQGKTFKTEDETDALSIAIATHSFNFNL
jgi:crossover junction endodeoxyribonuclease RuvC